MKFTRLRSLLIVVAAMIPATPTFAALNSWTLEGPEGGPVYSLAIHPTDPTIVLMGTPRGIYRSVDSGMSWTLRPGVNYNGVQDIAFDPTSPNNVVAAAGFIYLSEDGGQTFLIMQGPAQQNNVARIAFGSDGTLYAICYGGTAFRSAAPYVDWIPIKPFEWPIGASLGAIAVDPNDPQTVYVGVDEVGVFRTINRGVSWIGPLTSNYANPSHTVYWSLAVDPTQSTRVIVGSSAGIHVSTNRGDTWAQADSFPTSWVGFNPGISTQVTAIRAGGQIMRSTNRGATWPTFVEDLQTNGLPQARYFPGSSNHLLMTSDHGLADSIQDGNDYDFRVTGVRTAPVIKLVAGGSGQIFAAMNASFGSIFRRNLLPSYSRTLSVQGTNYISGVRNISALSASSSNIDTVFAVNSGWQLIRTFNGGGSWTAPHPAFSIGASADYLMDVKIAPSNDNVAYVGRQVTGVWKTTNGGSTFIQLASSPPFIGSMGVHPTNPNVVYASGGTADYTGIYKTTDGGVTWQQQIAPTTPAPGQPYGLWVNGFYFYPGNPNIVYATAAGGVRKTVDGGNNWTLVDFGGTQHTNVNANAMLIDPAIPTTMMMVGSFDTPGFLRTVDGGTTWDATALEVPGPVTIPQNAVLSANGQIVAGTSSAGVVEYTVAPDLSISMSSLPATLPQSSNVTATFTITNRGPHASSSSELTVGLPFFITPTVPAGCSFAAQLLRCPGGVLRVGESRAQSVTMFVGTGSTQGGISASVLGHETDVDFNNNNLTFNFDTVELADLDVTISSAAQVFDRGDATGVTVTASNSGPSPASFAQLSVQIPSNLRAENFVSSGGSCFWTTAMIECSLGNFAHDASVTVTFDVRGFVPGEGTLTASVQSGSVDPDSNHAAARDFTVRPVGDVSVTLTESADPVTLGDSFQYVATVRDNGPDAANVQLTVPVTGAVVTGATAVGGSCTTTTSSVSCTLSPMTSPQLGISTVTIDVNGTEPGIATANASVVFAGTDTVPGNNTASIGTTIRRVGDIRVDIADNRDPATVDEPFTYLATVSNAGPNPGAVHVTIPVTGAVVTVATPSIGTCSATASSVSCDIPSLASGASANIQVTVIAASPGMAGASATATFSGVDTNPGNNQAGAVTTVRLVGNLGVVITDTVDPATVDSPYGYAVTVRNDGPNPGAVQIVVPVSGATVTGASLTGGTCTNSASSATCSLAFLANGASSVMNVAVIAAAPGAANATATATFAGLDPDTTNNSATTTTVVRLVGDVSVTVTDQVDPADVDAGFRYTVTVRNDGPNAGAVTVNVPVTGVTVGSVTTNTGTCTNTPASATCNIASLASGGAAVINVNVSAGAPGTARATATATYTGVDPNTANNSATASTTIRLVGDVSVTVTDSMDPATTGVAYSYSVTVRNGGPNAGAVSVSVPVTGATVASATLAGGTCTNTASTVTCDIASLASNASAVLTINVSSSTVGSASAAATATFSGTDPDNTNNAASASTVVSAPPPPPPPATPPRSGGGGGGRFDWLALALLGGLVARKRWRAHALRA